MNLQYTRKVFPGLGRPALVNSLQIQLNCERFGLVWGKTQNVKNRLPKQLRTPQRPISREATEIKIYVFG